MEGLDLELPGVNEMLTIKGVGRATAAGLIAEVGDIRRLSHPRRIQRLAGLNLVENCSCKHRARLL